MTTLLIVAIMVQIIFTEIAGGRPDGLVALGNAI